MSQGTAVGFGRAPSDEGDAIRSLRTYYCYMQAFLLSCPTQILDSQRALPGFSKLQREHKLDIDSISKPLMRGWLTLRAMMLLPLGQHPELATTANFWAPVQAYYAVHGVGSAALGALGVPPSNDHRRFCASSSDQFAHRLFPFPFNTRCSGYSDDHEDCPTTLENTHVRVRQARDMSNLHSPDRSTAAVLVAKSLITTRQKLLGEQFKKARKELDRTRLRDEDKVRSARRLHATSVFDFFYRMRVRSNYDDPEMFIYGQADTATARSHYSHLLKVTKSVIELLECVIEKRCGAANFAKLRTSFERTSGASSP